MLQFLKKHFLEPVGIFFGLVIIFLIWLKYPTWIEWKDQPLQQNEKTAMEVKQAPILTFDALFKQEPAFIPYKLSSTQELSADIEPSPTKFQAIGEKYGTFGDAYGALNTLFSGLAFAVLIITMLMQRQELKEQRKELAQQREELAAQRKEAEQSNKIAEEQRKINKQQGDLIKQQIEIAQVQNFYTIFFKQLDILEADFNRLFPKGAAMQKNILESNTSSFLEFINHLNTLAESDLQKTKINLAKELQRVNDHINLYFQHSLFLKSLIQIFKFIDENKTLKGLDINQPINNLLTRLDDETLLSITWLAIAENEKLLNYLEEFSMLRTLSNVINEDQMKFLCHFISEKAFQEPVGTHST